jgi:hypothetical protein
MQNVNVVSKPTFLVVSNAVLVFAVSLICIMHRKMDKNIYRNCACIQSAFSIYRTEFTGKPSAPFEKAYNVGLKTK